MAKPAPRLLCFLGLRPRSPTRCVDSFRFGLSTDFGSSCRLVPTLALALRSRRTLCAKPVDARASSVTVRPVRELVSTSICASTRARGESCGPRERHDLACRRFVLAWRQCGADLSLFHFAAASAAGQERISAVELCEPETGRPQARHVSGFSVWSRSLRPLSQSSQLSAREPSDRSSTGSCVQ